MSASIIQIFWIVLPVFGVVGLGYLASWSKYLPDTVGEALGDFVFMVAIPVLLFRTLATAEFPDTSPWPLWISYFGGVLVGWVAADLMVRKMFRRDARAGVIGGISAGFSNAVLLGLPLTLSAFGEEGAVPNLLIVAVQLPVIMVVSTVLIEWAERRDGETDAPLSVSLMARSIALNFIKNPLVLGIVAGSLWRLAEWPYDGPLEVLGNQIASAAIPCALFALGMSLTRYGIRGNVLPAIWISLLKLFVIPAIAWILATQVFTLPPLWVTVVTLIAACPTGVNAWLLANRFRTGHAIAANTITLTSALSVITLSLWLLFLGY